jgi:hypothetical protein
MADSRVGTFSFPYCCFCRPLWRLDCQWVRHTPSPSWPMLPARSPTPSRQTPKSFLPSHNRNTSLCFFLACFLFFPSLQFQKPHARTHTHKSSDSVAEARRNETPKLIVTKMLVSSAKEPHHHHPASRPHHPTSNSQRPTLLCQIGNIKTSTALLSVYNLCVSNSSRATKLLDTDCWRAAANNNALPLSAWIHLSRSTMPRNSQEKAHQHVFFGGNFTIQTFKPTKAAATTTKERSVLPTIQTQDRQTNAQRKFCNRKKQHIKREERKEGRRPPFPLALLYVKINH